MKRKQVQINEALLLKEMITEVLNNVHMGDFLFSILGMWRAL